MRVKKRSIIQIAITLAVIAIMIIYYLYINEYTDFKLLSIGDMNPYGGWSALKSAFTDASYRFRGISNSIALTVAIVISAFLMGRFFCGYVCPIGALQDFFKYLGGRLRIREIKLKRWKYFHPEMIKYFVLIAVIVLSILGLGNIVSPYSPWIAYLNLFLGFNIRIGFIVLLLISAVSLFVRRIFCRVFCPLGAFQALLTAIGPSRLRRGQSCSRCTHCLKSCPVGIESPKGDEISPECIRCMECVNTNCIKGTEGHSLKFGRKGINSRAYVNAALAILIAIFIFLPLIGFRAGNEAFVQIEGLKDGLYTGTGIGFGGNMKVEVLVEDGRIKGINVISHNETTGYYEEVFRTLSREIVERQSIGVDAISGATTTSRGFLNAVRRGISQALEGK